MAVAQRIKGQEVTLVILADGVPQLTIDTIKSAELEWEIELLEEGYLGETSNRVDSVYNVIRVMLEGDINNQDYLELADAIAARARNRVGGATRIDIVGSFAFPNGQFPSVVVSDVYFENIPFNIGARNEFVSFTLTGKASDYTII